MTANMNAKMSSQMCGVLKAVPRVHSRAGFSGAAFLGSESRPKGLQPTLSGMGLAMRPATTRKTAMMTESTFMPICQPADFRIGDTTMVSRSWARGAPAKAMPQFLPYSAPTYHLRHEIVEETHSMPVPMPAKTP